MRAVIYSFILDVLFLERFYISYSSWIIKFIYAIFTTGSFIFFEKDKFIEFNF